jgi:quinol monooxygenase YgiN
MYGLHGKIIAQPGQGDALLQIMLKGVGEMLGCHLYIVSKDVAHADSLWVFEVWETQADHQASLKLEAVQAMIAQARPLIAGMSDRVEFTPVGGKGLPLGERK